MMIRCNQMSQSIVQTAEPFMQRLNKIWKDIGIPVEQQSARQNVVLLHISSLLEEMVNEEENLQKRLVDNIEIFSTKVAKLCQEMDLPKFKLEKELRNRYETLSKEKQDRLSRLRHLVRVDEELSTKMKVVPLEVSSCSVPSFSQLDLLEARIQEKKREMEKRQQLFNETKAKIMQLLTDLVRVPETAFERDVVCEPEELFVFSTENMMALKSFCDNLEQHRKANTEIVATLKSRLLMLSSDLQMAESEKETMLQRYSGCCSKTICALQEEVNCLESLKELRAKEVVEVAQKKLLELWDKCFYSLEQREPYQHLCQCDYKIVNLPLIQQEIEKVQIYYDSHREMLDKVVLHQQIFKDYTEMERTATHPDRFYNGSCNLLKEEKARSKLAKDVAEVEQNALCAVEDWEKKTGRLFLVSGSRFKDHVKNQWQEYKAEKADEQIRKLKAKLAQKETLSLGQKPVTPLKRRFGCMTPNKIAAKVLKIDSEGCHSAPQSYAFINSPRQKKADVKGGGTVIPREPVFITKVKPLYEAPFSPLSTKKRINHGCLFTPIHQPPSSAGAEAQKRELFRSAGVKSSRAKGKLVFEGKLPRPSAECSEENVDPIVFSCTTVVSGAQAIPDSDLKIDCGETASLGPSYQEFTKGLSENGKKNICSSSVLLDMNLKPFKL